MKRDVTDSWIPAIRENERKEYLRPELITDLQNRELSNNDYELLLQLDQLEKFPIQDYLMARLGGQKIGAENTKTLGEPDGMCTICRQSLKIHADIRSIPCGHTFHESCLSRSILSQAYVCPHPDCDHVLFPGLHQLAVKEKQKGNERDDQRDGTQNDKVALPSIGCSFSVLSLQQRGGPTNEHQLGPAVTGRDQKTKGMARSIKNVSGQATRKGSEKLPSMFGLQSVGLVPLSRPPAAGSNNQESENRLNLPSSSQSNRPSQSRVEHVRHVTPSPCNQESRKLPPLGFGNNASVDRMDQAGKTRLELQNAGKERLRKQRIQREERTRIHNANSSNQLGGLDGLTTTSFGGTISFSTKQSKAEDNRTAAQKRSQQEREKKRQSRGDRSKNAQQQEDVSNLCIGAPI